MNKKDKGMQPLLDKIGEFHDMGSGGDVGFDSFDSDDDEDFSDEDRMHGDKTHADVGVTQNRTDNFDLSTGRFRDQDNGSFEKGSSPPDYDATADRYRASDGTFKKSPSDHFDEPEEVAFDSLEPEG